MKLNLGYMEDLDLLISTVSQSPTRTFWSQHDERQ